MQSNFYQDRVVVITGGSSGIGFALAKEFIKQNAHVTIISRDKNKLLSAQEALAALTSQVSAVDIIQADVASQDQIVNAINAVGNKFGKIDVLINGAGIATYGRFKDQLF
ncbi:MAG TPA: SDR family NAD(P)-dependent oxidoreductase, partial [Segetibacter sp.]